jgi:MYXO-CTERM domain-containing protein
MFAFDRAALYTFSDPAPPTPTDSATSSDGQPGLGPLAGLAGLGAGALYALARRRRSGEESPDHKA